MGLVTLLNIKHILKTSESAMLSGREGMHVFHVIFLSRLQSLDVSEKHLGHNIQLPEIRGSLVN